MSTADKSAGIFDAIPPHLVRDGFLGPEMVAALLDYAQRNASRFEASTVGVDDGERVWAAWRVSSLLRDFGPLQKELRSRFKAFLPEALRSLGMPSFELYHIELELVSHGHGAFYNTHIDTANSRDGVSVRALTVVYYFHAEPKGFEGGDLRLLPLRHGVSEENYLDIEPLNDRLLVFPSWVPHRVMPVSCPTGQFRDSRFAINCWFRKLKA